MTLEPLELDSPEIFETSSQEIKSEAPNLRAAALSAATYKETKQAFETPLDPLHILNYWTLNSKGKTRTTNLAKVMNKLKHTSTDIYDGIYYDYTRHFIDYHVSRIQKYLYEYLEVKNTFYLLGIPNFKPSIGDLQRLIYKLHFDGVKLSPTYQICLFYADMIDAFNKFFWSPINETKAQKKRSLNDFVNYYFDHLPIIHLKSYSPHLPDKLQEYPLKYSQYYQFRLHQHKD